MALRLIPEEEAMLAGEQGPGVRQAIEIVVALGTIYGARALVPVESVQVAGVSYKNLGPAGLDFLREWADQGARVRVPTLLNPAGMDTVRWRELGVDPEFAAAQLAVLDAFAALGVETTCTCTPYHVGQTPALGDHLAWAESSAVSFANSVLGARTNREGGPSALAAAICGRTADYGLHQDENRLATVEVAGPTPGERDGRLGRARRPRRPTGAKPGPLFPRPGPRAANWDTLKSLGAAMAASGAVALYHVEGVTPEALRADMLRPDHETMVVENLDEGYRALSGDNTPLDIDLVWLGCPHASLDEIGRLAAACRRPPFRSRRLDHHQPSRAPAGGRGRIRGDGRGGRRSGRRRHLRGRRPAPRPLPDDGDPQRQGRVLRPLLPGHGGAIHQLGRAGAGDAHRPVGTVSPRHGRRLRE